MPQFSELLALVDHLIVSLAFAKKLTGEAEPAVAARKLWRDDRRAVVVTCGADGCWHVDAASVSRPCHQPAYRVQVVDTTGCGDVFHGAYATGLVRGLPLLERIRFASAAAALKATQYGGQAGIPSRTAVEEFLAGR